MPIVTLGTIIDTGEKLTIGDIERCGGLYILGKPRFGKSTLLINLALDDIKNGHGLLFIDPKADAINEILVRIPKHRQQDVILLDPTDETHAFSVNVLACANPKSMKERNITFSSAIDIFIKLFPNPQTGALDILLSKYLRNSFYPLIEAQGYTLADIPLFLTNEPFRESVLRKVSYNPEVVDFWHYEYAQLPRRDKIEEIESTLNRLNPLLTRDFTKYMVSQPENTVDFDRWMDTRKIVLLRMPLSLDDEIKSFIGTILISQLLKSITLRAEDPPQERIFFALYCDEFHLFASPDFAKLFTQTGSFNIMPTVAHQERLGQLKPYDPNLGATLAAPLKVLFSQTVHDSDELAPEYAKLSPIEIRLERQLAISQQPYQDLLLGHKHPDIHRFVQQYLHPLRNQLDDTQDDIEGERLVRQALLDEAAISRTEERREAFYNSLARGGTVPVSFAELDRTKQTLEEVTRHTDALLRLHDSARGLKLSIRSLNSFLTAIMEDRIQPEPGQELFSQFLLAFVRKSTPLPALSARAFELYISLVYGNQSLPRAIPVFLAAKHQLATQEEIYREIDEKYKQRVMAYCESVRVEAEAERAAEEQDALERVRKKIFTWKRRQSAYDFTLGEARVLYGVLQDRVVRTLLTPYFFARFAPPWYYDPEGRPSQMRDDEPPEEDEGALVFIRHYGEGALVTLSLLKVAFNGWGWGTQISTGGGRFQGVDDIRRFYPNRHMLEIPAIVGKEPFEVLRLIQQLSVRLIELEQNALDWWETVGRRHLESLVEREKDAHYQLTKWQEPASRDAAFWNNFPQRTRELEKQLRDGWNGVQMWDKRVAGSRHYLDLGVKTGYYSLGQVPIRADVQLLSAALDECGERAHTGGWWHTLDEQTRVYLILRACDLVTFGSIVADRTFPQPTLQGILSQQVSVAVTSLMLLLLKAQAEVKASRKQAWARQKEAFFEEVWWKNEGLLHYSLYQEARGLSSREVVASYLPPRTLTAQEMAKFQDACLQELRPSEHGQQGSSTHSALAALDAWVKFCQLLRQPENHVRGQTAQYVEREVNTYPTNEMRMQMAQELINLPRYTAYATVIQEQGDVQVVRKAKITTEELPKVPPGRLPEASRNAWQNAIDAGILRPRRAIEAESRTRLARWRRRVIDSQPPPSEEPPPALGSTMPPEPEEPPPSKVSLKNTPNQKSLNNRDVEQTTDPLEAIPASPSLEGLGQHAAEQPQPDEILPPPGLELVTFTFFESGKESLPVAHHRYSTRFPKSAARFINYQLTVKNLQQEYDRHYIEVLRYYNPDGSLFWEGQYHLAVKANLNPLAWSRGYGWEEPGHWTPGTFRVETLIGGVKVAEGSFTIEEPPPIAEKPPATSALQLESLKCYESGKGILQKDLRFYRIWFPKETTRYVNYELTVRNRLYKQRDQTCKVVVRYYKPDGNLFTTFTPSDWVITSDTEKTWYSCSSGWDEPGHWEPGDYRVEILIDGVEFAEGSFKIQKPRRRRG